MHIQRFGRNITTVAKGDMTMSHCSGSRVKPEDRFTIGIHTDEPAGPDDTVSFHVDLTREEVDRIVEWAAAQPRLTERNENNEDARKVEG